jgi:hypothetical protein
MFLNYVKGRIKVCIALITTTNTSEHRLAFSAISRDMPAFTAPTRRVSRLYKSNQTPFLKRFIRQKRLQLVKTPRHPVSLFLPVDLICFLEMFDGVLVDVSKVLKYNGGAWFQSRYNLFGYDVIHITSEAVLLAFDFDKVSFPRMSLALKNRPQSLILTRNLFDVPSSKEPFVRRNSNAFNTSVNPDGVAVSNGISNRLRKHNVQEYSAISDNQLSRTSFPSGKLLIIFWEIDRKLKSTINGLERQFVFVKPDGKGFVVVSNTHLFGLRASVDFWFSAVPFSSFLALKFFDRFNRFGGFDSGRDSQISREIFSNNFVSFVVKFNAIGIFVVVPSGLADEIISFGISLHSRQEDLRRGFEFKSNCTSDFHNSIYGKTRWNSLNDFENISQIFGKRRVRQFLPTHKWWGSLAA